MLTDSLLTGDWLHVAGPESARVGLSSHVVPATGSLVVLVTSGDDSKGVVTSVLSCSDFVLSKCFSSVYYGPSFTAVARSCGTLSAWDSSWSVGRRK